MRNPFFITLLVLLLMLIISLAIGSVFIPPVELWRLNTGTSDNETFRTILWNIRLPRTALIALIGAALAGSGAAYQGLFRNPLADPYLIGVASGAGLGAVLAMSVEGSYTTLGLLAVPMAAFVASLLTVYLVYTFAHIGRTVPTTNLILAGVAVSSFAVSVTSFLMLRSSSFATVRRVILPLLRPAIVAALVFSFVRAMTAISAVIFLVSANYDMATSYIIGRVENGDYGLAIAYSSALIVVMVAAILLIQLAVGQRRLGRRGYGEAMPMAGAA